MIKHASVVVSFIIAFFFVPLLSPSLVQATDLTISGDPLKITADDWGSISIQRNENGSYVKQHFEDLVSFLFLNNSDLAFDSHDPTTLGGASYANTRFTVSSHIQPNDWKIETVYNAGSTGVQVKRVITYTNGKDYYAVTYDIVNHGSTTYSSIKFRVGSDTYFAGDDSSVGHWDSTLKMVYLTNPDPTITHIMGLYGAVTSKADHYYNDIYTNVWTQLKAAATSLPDTVNSSDVDAGYGLEWDKTSLVPNETWKVRTFEKWTSSGFVEVVAPSTQSVQPGKVVQYQFSVENYQTTSDTFTIQASSSRSWPTNLSSGNKVTVGALSSAQVTVTVTTDTGAAQDTTDILTVTATSDTSSAITNSSTVNTTIAAVNLASVPGPPACLDREPTATPSLFQINTTQDSATLYFTPVNDNLSYYFIAYGLSEGDQTYGVEFPASPSGGVESYKIQGLTPNTGYYFRVRGGNGCAVGKWSNWLGAQTGSNIAFAYYESPKSSNGAVQGRTTQSTPVPTLIPEAPVDKQTDGYTIQVNVNDQKNKPVKGAKVILTSKPREAITDGEGKVIFENVEPGEHTIKITYQNQTGEKKIEITDSDVKGYRYTIQIQSKNPFSSPFVIIVIGLLLVLVLRKRLKILFTAIKNLPPKHF